MKKILFIAYLYPPIANSGTQRSLKFANYLPEFGWEPIVLTVENPPDQTIEPALLNRVRPGTRIERVPFWSQIAATKLADAIGWLAPRKKVIEGLEWRLRGAWQFPDPYAMWKPMVVKRGIELFHAEHFDCVYASGTPWSAFLAARDIGLATKTPYILDYRDTWTSWRMPWDQSSLVRKMIERALERFVIRQASAVIATTAMSTEKLKELLPASRHHHLHCIENGYDPPDFEVFSQEKIANTKTRLVYVGMWKTGYTLEPLYEAIKGLFVHHPEIQGKLEIIAGGFPPGKCAPYRLESTVCECGRVPHATAISLMHSADILYLPTPEGEDANAILPGKVFEYLATGKPILAVAHKGSEVDTLLQTMGGAIVVAPGDMKALQDAILKLVEQRKGFIPPRDVDAVRKFERRTLTGRLAVVFDGVLVENKNR